MRANPIARPHPSRRAHARSTSRKRLRMRAPQDEDSIAFQSSSRCQTAHLVPAAHVCARVLHSCFTHPEPRGGRSAEKRSGACDAPVGRAVSRHARRLRGALRPMTQQYTGRNNVTISMPDGGSVPIVSQTEIEPMKTALSLMLALITTTALTEPLPVPKPPGPGGCIPCRKALMFLLAAAAELAPKN